LLKKNSGLYPGWASVHKGCQQPCRLLINSGQYLIPFGWFMMIQLR